MTADQQNVGWVADALRVHEEQAREEEGHSDRRGSPQPLPGTVREELVLERIDRARRSRPRVKEERITMSHGAGGKATQTLIEAIFLDEFRNPLLEPLEDAARLRVGGARLAFTTDSYVVSPLFFPGGSIGDLAVNGTVNDLAMSGATPLFLSAGFILEEGFPEPDRQVHARGGRRSWRPGGYRRHQGGGAGQGRRLLHQHGWGRRPRG
jgi:hydrogenase expression/formation protein HypE